ncbi:response regulator transcription factor [Patescibacteria group bacterium]|nr:response regulator transcription factor [Patescibacteria group bacterium]
MKKILIIDDDATFRKTLSDSLSPDKYIVSTAVNGKDGLEKIKNDKPDLIILDISMPEMGGIELLQNLKEESINVPILIASQLSQIEVVSESIETGVNIGVKGYILKASESLDMIIQTIEKTLAQ